MSKKFLKSVAAGGMIGIACRIYLAVGGGVLGAILFSIGLLGIVLMGFNLYTGKIGYATTRKDFIDCALYVLGNFIGIACMAYLSWDLTTPFMFDRIFAPPPFILARAIGCGFLMHMAVDIYQKKNSIIGVLACVPAFILCGFEHSIADMFYLLLMPQFYFMAIPFIILVIAGNAIGAQLHKLLA